MAIVVRDGRLGFVHNASAQAAPLRPSPPSPENQPPFTRFQRVATAGSAPATGSNGSKSREREQTRWFNGKPCLNDEIIDLTQRTGMELWSSTASAPHWL
jgi:hypothetical protein